MLRLSKPQAYFISALMARYQALALRLNSSTKAISLQKQLAYLKQDRQGHDTQLPRRFHEGEGQADEKHYQQHDARLAHAPADQVDEQHEHRQHHHHDEIY